MLQIENLRQNYSHFYLKEFSATTIAGNPAHKIEFTATDDKEEKRKAMLIWTLKDEKALYLRKPIQKTFTLQNIQNMINHLKQLNQTKKIRNLIN